MSRKIQRNEPCPCGSGKKYKNCCMQKQRDKSIERAERREAIQKALGWLSHHSRPQIDDWVEKVWLDGIDDADRQGIATADPRIRGIHDINLLEQLVAEGSFENMEGENRPLQMILAADELALNDNQRSYLQQLAKRPLRLYRVTACSPGESFTLEESPQSKKSEPVTIEDKWASRMFEIGDTIGLRLMQSDTEWETSGAIYHIPDEYVEELQAELKKAKAADFSRTLTHYWLKLVAAHA